MSYYKEPHILPDGDLIVLGEYEFVTDIRCHYKKKKDVWRVELGISNGIQYYWNFNKKSDATAFKNKLIDIFYPNLENDNN